MLRRTLAFVTIAVACSGPAKRPPVKPVAGETRTYQPLAIKDDAKRPNQAVILGTDERNGSMVVPLPSAPSKAAVDAMFVKLGGAQGATGGMSTVTLATAPNTEQTVQVGVFEELSGGTGAQWRAGVWVSAIIAATTLNKDLTDFTFSASSGGYIDGASASGLMAAGFLATLTGEKIDPSVTMTGIINPDGTIGPVGGIPEKLQYAIDKGKKRIGYPIGMRYSRSAATGKLVDLEKLAKDGGAEAVELGTVFDAYMLLTGKRLPEPVPVAVEDMAIDAETTKAIDAKYKDWQTRLGTEWAQLLQLQQSGRLPQMLAVMAAFAQQRGEQAEKLHDRGLVAAAYAKILEAWVYAASATDTYGILVKLQAGDVAGAVGELGKLDQLDRTTAEVFQKIGATQPSTIGSHLGMIAAYQAALRGWGYKMFASESVAGTRKFLRSFASRDPAVLTNPDEADKVVANVAPTVLLIGRTVAETVLAAQRLEFENEKTLGYTSTVTNVKRVTTSYQSASAAGINYFDTLLVQPLAESAGMPLDAARTRLAVIEPNYLVAFMLSRLSAMTDGLPAQLKAQWGETSVQWSLMSLAASQLAYEKSAELVTKYYSLGLKADAGRVTQVEHEKAFLHMLVTAERTARTSARAAKIATGAIPIQARLAYQLATVQAKGDLADQIEALASFWTSTAFSQTAVMLARN
ncbi:MAG TPA: S16 family serine protease [Kofleriaceae bacterium]|nr:S16 family serine protease [Kofleriaceae bacterium]